MGGFKSSLSTSVGRKYLMAVSGLALFGFMINHLAANLLLYAPAGDPYNKYVQTLHSWGPILTVLELGLAAVFVFHILIAFGLKLSHKAARPQNYKMLRSKGGDTPSNPASRNMIVTGIILLVFLVIHVWQFRFGPGMAEGYSTVLGGEETRDLYRLVIETFQSPLWVLFYMGVMIFLGMHLRHGFWSAFQSLGMYNQKFSAPIYVISLVSALVIMAGFLFIPLWIFFDLSSMFI